MVADRQAREIRQQVVFNTTLCGESQHCTGLQRPLCLSGDSSLRYCASCARVMRTEVTVLPSVLLRLCVVCRWWLLHLALSSAMLIAPTCQPPSYQWPRPSTGIRCACCTSNHFLSTLCRTQGLAWTNILACSPTGACCCSNVLLFPHQKLAQEGLGPDHNLWQAGPSVMSR